MLDSWRFQPFFPPLPRIAAIQTQDSSLPTTRRNRRSSLQFGCRFKMEDSASRPVLSQHGCRVTRESTSAIDANGFEKTRERSQSASADEPGEPVEIARERSQSVRAGSRGDRLQKNARMKPIDSEHWAGAPVGKARERSQSTGTTSKAVPAEKAGRRESAEGAGTNRNTLAFRAIEANSGDGRKSFGDQAFDVEQPVIFGRQTKPIRLVNREGPPGLGRSGRSEPGGRPRAVEDRRIGLGMRANEANFGPGRLRGWSVVRGRWRPGRRGRVRGHHRRRGRRRHADGGSGSR